MMITHTKEFVKIRDMLHGQRGSDLVQIKTVLSAMFQSHDVYKAIRQIMSVNDFDAIERFNAITGNMLHNRAPTIFNEIGNRREKE